MSSLKLIILLYYKGLYISNVPITIKTYKVIGKRLNMATFKVLQLSLPLGFLLFLSSVFITVPGVIAWSKEGHEMTCQIAQVNFGSTENIGSK